MITSEPIQFSLAQTASIVKMGDLVHSPDLGHPTVIALEGLSATGKSTLVEQLKTVGVFDYLDVGVAPEDETVEQFIERDEARRRVYLYTRLPDLYEVRPYDQSHHVIKHQGFTVSELAERLPKHRGKLTEHQQLVKSFGFGSLALVQEIILGASECANPEQYAAVCSAGYLYRHLQYAMPSLGGKEALYSAIHPFLPEDNALEFDTIFSQLDNNFLFPNKMSYLTYFTGLQLSFKEPTSFNRYIKRIEVGVKADKEGARRDRGSQPAVIVTGGNLDEKTAQHLIQALSKILDKVGANFGGGLHKTALKYFPPGSLPLSSDRKDMEKAGEMIFAYNDQFLTWPACAENRGLFAPTQGIIQLVSSDHWIRPHNVLLPAIFESLLQEHRVAYSVIQRGGGERERKWMYDPDINRLLEVTNPS